MSLMIASDGRGPTPPAARKASGARSRPRCGREASRRAAPPAAPTRPGPRPPARAAPRHRCVDGDVVADAAGDVVLQAGADDAVMVGLKSPEPSFAQDRTEGINQRLPQVGPVAPGPGHQRELHRGQAGPYGGHLRLHEPVGEFLFHAGRSEDPAIRWRTAGRPRPALAGPSPPRAMTPVGLAAEHGCCTPRAKPLGDRERVVVQVPAAHSQWHLIEEADSGWRSCSSVPWPSRRRVDCGRRSGETGGRRGGARAMEWLSRSPGMRRPARDGSFPAAIRRVAETLARVGQ